MAAPVRLELTTHLLETWSRCSSLPPSLPVSAVFAAPVFAATGSHSRYEAVNSRMRLSKHKLFCLCLAQITKKEDRPFGLSSFLAPPVWLEQTTLRLTAACSTMRSGRCSQDPFSLLTYLKVFEFYHRLLPLFTNPVNRPVFTNILIHITGGIHFSAAACTVNISGQQGLTFGVLSNMLFLLIITGALF